MFAGGLTGGAATVGALQIGATGASTDDSVNSGASGSPAVIPIVAVASAAVMPPPPLVVSDSTPTPSPQVSTTNASAQQFPASSSSFGLGLAGLAAASPALGGSAASVPSASSAAAAALVRKPSGLASGMMMGLAPAAAPPSATVPSAASSIAASAGGDPATAGSSTTGTSAAASSVIFTPSSMAQETAGQRATRSLSYSITSVSGGSNASAAAVPPAPSSTASILTLFDPSAVSPDLSSASNTHASSASFRFSSSASPAHGHPARPFSPLTSNPAAAQAAAAAAVAAGPLALAPAPVPAVSPVLRKSFTTGATATMSSIRQKIREQISGMRKEKGRRDQEDVVREWSTCLAKWNQYQPAVSGTAASLNGLSQKELAANQKKLSGMLLSSGIPSHMRASVWLLMIGNGLGLTPQSFEALRASCEEKRKEYEAWRKQTNSNHLNAKHRHLAEAEAAAAAAAAAAVTAASSSGAEVVPAAASSDPSASPASSSSASMPTFHPSPSPSPSSSSASSTAAAGSATPQSVASSLSFDSGNDASLDPSCAMFSLIDQDLPRTFPELAFFHHDGPYEEPLRVVLEATAAFRAARERERIEALALQEMGDPSLAPGSTPAPVFESSSASSSGYVQGMSFLTSILFLALGDDDPFLAFVALTNLLENPAEPLSQLFSMRVEIMEDWLLRFDAQFLTSLPKLHAHFSQSIGLTTDMFLYKWIFSVYAQSLHLDAVFRVWDCFLWESFKNRGPAAAGVASAGAGNAAAATSLGAGNAVASNNAQPTAGASPASPTSATSAASASSPTPTAAAASTASASSSAAAPATVSASSALHVHSGHGFPFLFRVALGILSMFSDALCSVGFEECLHFLHHLPGKAHNGSQSGGGAGGADEMLDIDLLFQHVRTIKMEPSIWGAGMASK